MTAILTRRLLESLRSDLDPARRLLDSLVGAAEGRGRSGAHPRRVAESAANVSRLMGLTEAEVQVVKRAALFHDVGKVAIPEDVLGRRGTLSDAEMDLVRLHPVFGASILARVDGMSETAAIVLHHHERWDGTGYPSGLAGADIPVGARIVFVCDSYDAMTSARPYGVTLSPDEALAEVRRCSGKQFDPVAVEALHEAYRLGLVRRGG